MNKFKKALKMPILAMMAASCALSATACNVEDSGNNENHKHTYKSSWTYDNENHWHQADCGHDVKSDEAPHTDSDKDGLCDICFKDLNTSTEEPGETIIHTVTVVLNGGVIDGNKTEYSVKHGEAVILFNPTRSGYTFEGWYEDQELKKPFTRGSAINEDKTLYAKWNVNTSGGTPEIKTYTVTFNSNGGSKVSSQYIDENKTIVRPSAPVLDGKFFVNWYLDSALTQVWNFNNPVTSDMTLYAKWADPVTPALIEAKGYSESLYVTWKDNSPENAKVYYKTTEETTWKLLDSQLIRAISGTVARADIVGLKEGNYNVKILPSKGAEIEVPAPIAVAAYDRSGYAHHNYDKGIGAYNDDGTIKDNTLVIYVTDENKNNAADFAYVNGEKVDISQYLKTSSDKENYGGIGYILNNRGYASNTERENYGIQKLSFTYDAVAIRIIGTVKAEQNSDGTSTLRGLTDYNSTGNGGSVGDNGRMARITNAKNLTIEGIGDDACMQGWGVHFISNDNLHKFEGAGTSFEVRNITFDKYPEDAIGMEGTQGTKVDANGSITSGASDASADLISPVERCWIHNNVFLPGYCANPAESDKAEGDGSCDFKRGQYYTLSYNYFTDCHKTNLIGSSDSSLTYNVTMHHNWWNNCGSRQPLARRANIHYYNNYISGDMSQDPKPALSYIISARANCFIFAENNYFEGSKSVVEVASGGVVKSFGNTYYACFNGDASVQAQTRTAPVSNSCQFIYRKIDYSRFDTNTEQFYYNPETKQSDCLLDDSLTARVKVMQYAGVNGFGTSQTDMNKHTPTSAVQISNDGETPITLPGTKGDSEANGVLFRGITGASSGTVKFKGQGITFKLSSQAQLTVTTTTSGDSAPELVGLSGRVYLGKFTGTHKIVLEAGTYFIASGMKDKEATITQLIFESTAGASKERIEAVNKAIDAIPDINSLTLNDADKVDLADEMFKVLQTAEKQEYAITYADRYDKLNMAKERIKTLRVQHVIDLIDAIGEVNANSYDKINAAQEAYDRLGNYEDEGSATLQNRVTNHSKLVEAWNKYANFAVTNVINSINSLIDLSTIDIGDRTAVESAQAAYSKADTEFNQLTEEQQKLVTNSAKLTNGMTTLLQLGKLFDFKDLLASLDPSEITIANANEVGTLQTTHSQLTAEQLAKLSADENSKYEAILAAYREQANAMSYSTFIGGKPSASTITSTGGKQNAKNTKFTVKAWENHPENKTGTGELASGLKLESTTELTVTITVKKKLSLYFDGAGKVKINGKDVQIIQNADGDFVAEIELEAGSHKISKNTSLALYFATSIPV